MPGPSPVTADRMNRMNDEGSSQKLMLFMRGKAMSGAPIIIGSSQLPKPPKVAGITVKNTITKAWPVMKTL